MAIQTITYTDKVALNDDPSVADINKCKASDLNEIKSVVNNNANEIPTNTNQLTNGAGFTTLDEANGYSTTETVIGKWTNGKPIYRKVIPFQTVNNPTLYIAHNITDIDLYWINESASFMWKSGESLGVNWYYNTNDWCRTWVRTADVVLRSPSSLGTRDVYVVIEYTKTTD